MSYYDDDDKYDDDVYYGEKYDDDPYDEDEDEEEDSDSSSGSSLRSRINPYSGGTGGLPGRSSTFGGGGINRSPTSRDDSSRSSGSSGAASGGSPFYRGGSSSSSGSSSSGSSGSSDDARSRIFGNSGGARPGTSGTSGTSSSSSPFRSSGSGSSSTSGSSGSSSSGGSFSSRFGSSGSSGSSPSSPSSSSPSRPSSAGSSPFSRSSSAADDKDKKDDAKDKPKDDKDAKSGNPLSSVTSRLGGISSPFSRGGDKKDDKSSDGKSSITGALGGLTGGLSGMLKRGGDDKASDKKDDSKPASRLFGGGGGGSSSADKDKKPAGSSPLSSVTSRFGGLGSALGRGGDKPADNKPSASKPADSKPSAFGNITSRFRGSSGDSAPSSGSGASSASSAPKPGTGSGFRPPFGGGARPAAGGGDDKSAAKPASKAKPAESGSLFSRITQSFPTFGSGAASSDAGRASKTRRAEEKRPRVHSEGLSLDRKLDILGVGLVFGALMLFFSALSADQGAITGQINSAFSQLLGWGAAAVPITMFAVGAWLIVRHFGDDAPTLEMQRLIGIIMAYVGLLLLFQYIETFNPIYDGNVDFFRFYVRESGRGGGVIGTELYLFIVENIGELGGIFILIGWFIVSIMLITETSAAELAVIIMSFWRSFQIARQRRAQKRAAAALLAKQQAEAQAISISRPDAAGELPAGLPSLPAMGQNSEQLPLPIEQRSIPIRMGGQMITASGEEQQAVPALQAGASASAGDDKGSGGLIGGLLNAMPWTGSSKPEEPAASKTSDNKILGGIFGRKPDQAAPSAPPPRPPLPGQGSVTTSPQKPPTMPNGTPIPQNGGAGTAGQQPAAFQTPQPGTAASGNGVGGAEQQFMRPSTSQPAAGTNGAPSGAPTSSPQTAPHSPFSSPSQTPPAAASAAPSGAHVEEEDEAGSSTDRMERLNQLRSGVNRPVSSQQAMLNIMREAEDDDVVDEDEAQPSRPTASANGGIAPTPVKPGEERTMPNPVINIPRAPQAVPTPSRRQKSWMMPDYLTLLSSGSEQDFDRETLVKRARIIEETLQSFGAPGRVVEINTGPVITQFGVEPDYLTARGGKKSRVKVSAIAQLDKDLQLALGAKSIRIEAPVPGKGFVGIEVPNEEASLVSLRDVMESREFKRIKTPLAIALGQSVDGAPVAADLTQMPHLLIAGTTGSGKSVCVNAIIASLILRNTPDTVKFIMVDPKRVELTGYNGIPHLVAPVVVELERIVGVLKWVTREMDERYKKFSNAGARNITDYNVHLPEGAEIMPYIVVIIDELADLMMLAPEETERVITRIAALARATGIHLVIATQRPSVDVVTGLIKANFPARIAFAVASGTDSRVILDSPGAERLLGKGDMLYMSGDSPAPNRLQGVFVSDLEINNMTRYWRAQQLDGPQRPITALIMDDSPIPVKTSETPEAKPTLQQAFWDAPDDDEDDDSEGLSSGAYGQEDELYEEAVELVRRLNKASVSLLQRRLRIGYTRASRLIDVMEERGVVGPPTEGSKPRVVMPYK